MDCKERRERPSQMGLARFLSLLRRRCHLQLGRAAISVIGIAIAGAAMQPRSGAASILYPLSSFTLYNSNADGTVASLDGGLSAVLTGGNNGSGLAGSTDLLAVANGTGAISFEYMYSSADAQGYDWAGYVIGDQLIILADTDGVFGTAAFSVFGGDTFGFRVVTFDNTQEPGVFTISGFSSSASSVPEPSATLLVAAVLAMAAAIGRHRFIQQTPEKKP